MKISAFIIAYNEELNIARCINSLKPVVDEIILVDSYSQDKTVQIAESLGAKIFFHKFSGFGEQKAFAIEQTTNDWILSIDADEVISPQLQQSILEVKQNNTHQGYSFSILTNYCGKWIRHCGWYPQPKLRLLNKQKGHINKKMVHEGLEMNDKNEPVCLLNGDLLHHSYNTISDHSRKIQLYTEMSAKNSVALGRTVSMLKIIVAPRWVFIYHYIIRLGFLDGYWGYILCKNISYESFIKYTKIRIYSKAARKALQVA